jgi:RNA polymerase sigma factor (sigma-70 family)
VNPDDAPDVQLSDEGQPVTETDRELWAQAAAGSGEAFGVLFDRHSRAVYNHCFRLTASWTAAEDLTSTVFLQAWRHRQRLRLHGDSCRAWLLAVANNAVRQEHRTLRRRLALVRKLPPPDVVADPAEGVVSRLDDQRRMVEVLAAIRLLPRGEQDVVALCLWAGVSYPEAAAALGVAEGTVRARVSRARARLRQLADPPEPPPSRSAAAAPVRVTNPRVTNPRVTDPGVANSRPAASLEENR